MTLSLFSSKLAIYLIPVMPFMVLLFVEVLRRTGWKKWMSWALAVPVGFIAILAIAIFIGLCFRNSFPSLAEFIEPYSFLNSWTLKLALLLILSGMVFSLYYLLSKKNPSVALMFVGASMLLAGYTVSSAIPKANDWIGYGNLCETIPSDAEVATVRIRRPLPMKVYLGREVTDYQKDFKAFKESEIDGREVSDGPLVLLTRTGKIGSDEDLAKFVENNNHWFVGPYCAISYIPEDNNPQQLNEL